MMLSVNQENLLLGQRKWSESKHTNELALDIHSWLKRWETGDSHLPPWSKSRDPALQPQEHPTWIANPGSFEQKMKSRACWEEAFPTVSVPCPNNSHSPSNRSHKSPPCLPEVWWDAKKGQNEATPPPTGSSALKWAMINSNTRLIFTASLPHGPRRIRRI